MAEDLVKSSGSCVVVGSDDDDGDVCSICLEDFISQDPPTVTKCKHEYHLQCILEWSQRSKECPICWQLLVLENPASQELLAAVQCERNLRSRVKVTHVYEEFESDQDALYTDDSDFEERIMWNFATAASRARIVKRRQRQRQTGVGPSHFTPSFRSADVPVMQQVYTSLEEFHNLGYSSHADSPTSQSISIDDTSSSVIPSTPETFANRDCSTESRFLRCESPNSPRRLTPSEILTFSVSVKSKLSAASARYKESLSKGTRGLKEKLLARNSSVKELGRGVQREMSAGIAGVARMIERLDLASKRTSPMSSCAGENSNFSCKGKSSQENLKGGSLSAVDGQSTHDMRSNAPRVSLPRLSVDMQDKEKAKSGLLFSG